MAGGKRGGQHAAAPCPLLRINQNVLPPLPLCCQVVVDTEQIAKALLANGQLRNRVTIIPLNKVGKEHCGAGILPCRELWQGLAGNQKAAKEPHAV